MTLQLNMWNVDHGSAAYVSTPNDKRFIFDLGTLGGFSILESLKKAGISYVDRVTITHPHMDHIDDILNLDGLDFTTLCTPRHLTEDDIRGGNPKLNGEPEAKIKKYLQIRDHYAYPVDLGSDATLPQNNAGVKVQTFCPSQSSTSNLNNHSIVTILEYEGLKILIPGDNESPSWEELLSRSDFREAIRGTDVLVAAHHGRESGFHRPLFDYFNPYITLISDGRVVGTSVTGKYDDVTIGWPVQKRGDGTEHQRKCLTTRNDGLIKVKVSPNPPGGCYLDVSID